VILSSEVFDTPSGKPADSRVDLMKSTTAKRSAVQPVAAKKPPMTLQRFFDKWFLPVVFVAIGSLIVWAIWRH
jgi:hypothetical protein